MKLIYITIILLLTGSIAKAQTSDFGIWTSAEITKKLKKWDFSVEGILRTRDNASQLKRWGIKGDVSLKVLKPLKLGVSYQYITFNDIKYNDYQPRQRYTAYITGKLKLNDFSFSLREQAQRTIKDESDRIKESGKYDNYKINPEYIWRNKLQAAYNIPHFPVTPSISVETFYQLNNPDGNQFCDLRYTLSFEYKITRHQQIELYGLIDKEINVNNPVQSNVIGVGYYYSF